jgi:hypothetical protein
MVKASDLIQQQQDKDKSKDKIFKKIYKRIESRIQTASNANLSECWYEVPEFIYNIPLYKIENCIKYLINKLKHDGFVVKSQNNIIHISWKVIT